MSAAGNHIAEPADILVNDQAGPLPSKPAWDTHRAAVADVEMLQGEVSLCTQEVMMGMCIAEGAPMDVDTVVAPQVADAVRAEDDSNMRHRGDGEIDMDIDGIAAPHTLITPHLMFSRLGYTGLLYPANMHQQANPLLLSYPINSLQPLSSQPPSKFAVNSYATLPIFPVAGLAFNVHPYSTIPTSSAKSDGNRVGLCDSSLATASQGGVESFNMCTSYTDASFRRTRNGRVDWGGIMDANMTSIKTYRKTYSALVSAYLDGDTFKQIRARGTTTHNAREERRKRRKRILPNCALNPEESSRSRRRFAQKLQSAVYACAGRRAKAQRHKRTNKMVKHRAGDDLAELCLMLTRMSLMTSFDALL
ncbi:predicted protein [Postia placenta Mad-698-R]|nr:predicted protein [Postia placenta Mad-698-R]